MSLKHCIANSFDLPCCNLLYGNDNEQQHRVMNEGGRTGGYHMSHLSAIFQADTLLESDDVVVSTVMATVDAEKPRP